MDSPCLRGNSKNKKGKKKPLTCRLCIKYKPRNIANLSPYCFLCFPDSFRSRRANPRQVRGWSFRFPSDRRFAVSSLWISKKIYFYSVFWNFPWRLNRCFGLEYVRNFLWWLLLQVYIYPLNWGFYINFLLFLVSCMSLSGSSSYLLRFCSPISRSHAAQTKIEYWRHKITCTN